LDLFPNSDRTEQSIKTKITNIKTDLLKKLTAKASSNIESSGMLFFFLYLTNIAEFEEFCQPLFVHSTNKYLLVFPKDHWKDIKV
jgi:hypothetical protein